MSKNSLSILKLWICVFLNGNALYQLQDVDSDIFTMLRAMSLSMFLFVSFSCRSTSRSTAVGHPIDLQNPKGCSVSMNLMAL